MTSLSAYVITFNCARTPVHREYFSANLFNALPASASAPDLLVFSLQELAPITFAFLGGSWLTPYFAAFSAALNDAVRQKFGLEPYVKLAACNVGMTGIMVFARPEFEERARVLATAGTGVGLWKMGNKGAVGVRLKVDGRVTVTFVGAHLAPMELAWERRNEDWKNICQDLVFEGPSSGSETEPLLGGEETGEQELFDPPSYIYLAGDLNYRASDQPPGWQDHESWPQPGESSRHYDSLLQNDQLRREQGENATLQNFVEAPVQFPPTYKYSSAAQKLALSTSKKDGVVTSSTDELPRWQWAKHRVPSWCDRILYLSHSAVQVQNYTALPVQPTSDHRPVVLSCSFPAKPIDTSVKNPFPVSKDWRESRKRARQLEYLIGLLSYPVLTMEGRLMVLGTIIGVLGGYFLLRALFLW
ncbi:DNase I-like protein [Piedraia hortae CBS 480.64]|uniref:DNase I-like protein n=1 Tax=Piedraia hortae CBS 480.64 TaxID=1314780 RepID=A0A6A7BRV8_9PEZI|nr:DNase I-like protein [Piedraia hortae CBS 480.64]